MTSSTVPAGTILDLARVLRLFPDPVQVRAKAVAAAIVTVLTTLLPLLVTFGADLPPWVALVVAATIASLGTLVVEQTTNLEAPSTGAYAPRHAAGTPEPPTLAENG